MPETYLLKRTSDIFLALIGIMFFLPFWSLFCILIWLEAKGPVFYIQERIGREKKPFKTLKFRTLYTKKSGDIDSSKLGGFLRVTALDESLQLINILKGQMSFVGPRPLVPEEIGEQEKLSPRFLARPGLTGISQVIISKDTTVNEKFKYDLWYIKNQSPLLDLRLIIFSFIISFKGRWESRKDKLGFSLRVFNSF